MTRTVWVFRAGHYVRRLDSGFAGRVALVSRTSYGQYCLVDFGFENVKWVYGSDMVLLPPMRQYRREAQ